MSYDFKVVRAAVEQEILFPSGSSLEKYIKKLDGKELPYTVEQVTENTDGTILAKVRKPYNNNKFIDDRKPEPVKTITDEDWKMARIVGAILYERDNGEGTWKYADKYAKEDYIWMAYESVKGPIHREDSPKNEIISFQEAHPKQYDIGLRVDKCLRIYADSVMIGTVHLNQINAGWYIEWIEFLKEHRGKHYLKGVLIMLFFYLQTDKLHFTVREELKPMYEHLGCKTTGYDEFSEMYKMLFQNRRD